MSAWRSLFGLARSPSHASAAAIQTLTPNAECAGAGQPLSRRDQILQGLKLAQSVGAEIGPLDRPLVSKEVGRVFYVDHCDTDTLKARWASDPGVDVSKLLVDAVWGQTVLRDALIAAGAPLHASQGLDYVVASHVLEHVPDLVSWLREVRDVLGPAGTLRLAVPDRRYTFDINRRTSSLAEVLDAYVRRRRAPSGSRVLDFALNMVQVDVVAAWRGSLNMDQLQRGYTDEGAIALAHDAEANGAYHDVHCWVFTPDSFVDLMMQLARCNLLEFSCEWLVPTAENTFEFFVSMRPEADHTTALSSWKGLLR